MKHINRVQILGNAGADPERHTTNDGMRTFVTFGVATSHRWRDEADEQRESTTWHRVIAGGGLADLVEQHVARGDPVLVEGRLATRTWQDAAGMERRTVEIQATDVIFLKSRAAS